MYGISRTSKHIGPRYVIAGDPGQKNFGLAIYKRRHKKYRLLGTCQLDNPVRDLKPPQYTDLAKAFLDEWDAIFTLSGSKLFILERFMARGINSSNSEFVNVMIGLLTCRVLASKGDIQLITAAIWKNQYHRCRTSRHTLQELYKEVSVSNHRVDAALIGQYTINKFDGFKGSRSWITRLEVDYAL